MTAMFIGRIPGTIGEVSVIALLIGAAYLIVRKVISIRIPAAYLITFSVFVFIFGQHDLMYVLTHLCGGGIIFGAFFMATDYVTSPVTPQRARSTLEFSLVYLPVCSGFSEVQAEGVSYAIIISNILVPLIEKISLPKAFGKEGK